MSGLIRLGIPTSWLEQGWFWRKLANTQLWKSNRSWQFQKCIQSIQFEFLPPPSLSFHHTCSTLEASDHASDLVETSDFSFSFSCLVKRPSGLSASGQNGNVSGKSNDPSIWYVWYGAYDAASPACTSTFISPPFQYMEHIWKQSKTIKKQVHKGAKNAMVPAFSLGFPHFKFCTSLRKAWTSAPASLSSSWRCSAYSWRSKAMASFAALLSSLTCSHFL